MTGDALHLFDTDKKLIMKSQLSNQSLQIQYPNYKKKTCLESIDELEWLWHTRYVHLNFKSLSELCSKNLVLGLPKMSARSITCEMCMRSKQSIASFDSKISKI